MDSGENAGWKRGDPIGYIREQIPEFEVPHYEGERYEALVPDTLDLQERAALVINGMTATTDPLADYEIYSFFYFDRNPPMMNHCHSDGNVNRFMHGTPLMRLVSGSNLNMEIERRWIEAALHSLGPDGLVYMPVKGRPWTANDEFFNISAEGGHVISPCFVEGLLAAMLLYSRRDGRSMWKREAERMVDGLAALAIDRGRYAFFAPSAISAKKSSTAELEDTRLLTRAHVGFTAYGLVEVYRETGYGPAATLTEKLFRYGLEELHYFGEDGSFTPCVSETAAHFHMHSYWLLTMLEYARLVGDERLMELVHKGYRYGKAKGDTLLGYFPETIGHSEFEHSELCEVADMIQLGLRLTEIGLGDCWDDVDRWVRNMFAEGQLTPSGGDWLKRHVEQMPASASDPVSETTDRVIERSIGTFAGWPSPNDWYTGRGPGIMCCCTGNAPRAIYRVWEHTLTYADGNLRVNLLFNRASPWVDVDSHIPYVGQVDLKVKRPVNLSVRIPEWVNPGETRCQVNGIDRQVSWDGRYAQIGDVKPGDVATITFPIAERTDAVWIEKHRYRVVRKGNDVVAIDPPGQVCPLYQREHYRENSTRWRKVERFLAKEQITW